MDNPEPTLKVRKRQHRLVYTLFLSFLLVGTAPLLLSAWKFVGFSKSWLETNLRVLQLENGKNLSAEIEQYIESCKSDFQLISTFLGTNQDAAGFARQIHAPEFDLFLKEQVKTGNLSHLHVLTPDGTGVTVWRGAPENEDVEQLRRSFRAGLETADFTVGSRWDPHTKRHEIIVTKKVTGRGDETLGVILGMVNLEKLTWRMRRLGLVGEIIVVDNRSQLVFSNEPSRTEFAETELVSELMQLTGQVKNVVYESAEDGTRKIATLVPVPNLGWSVIVQADEKTTYYPVDQIIRGTFLWVALAVLLSGALGFLISKKIGEPLRQLVASSKTLASGNFKERVEVRADNEIGELADYFNLMSAKIQTYVDDLRTAALSNRQLFLEAVQTIASAIDEKDPYTRGHSERVTRYAVAIAEELQLPPEEVENVRIGALLHDVGKLGVPDELLQRPDELEPHEMELMKQHPSRGARLIGQISQLRDVLPGILYHHEFLDGSGYPEGLKGSQIPLSARIISVANSFDAATRNRPYRSGSSAEAAIEELEQKVESLYDPQVVEALKLAISKDKVTVQRAARKLTRLGRPGIHLSGF